MIIGDVDSSILPIIINMFALTSVCISCIISRSRYLSTSCWENHIMGDIRLFIKNFWSYYLELEQQFLKTKQYVEFAAENDKTYSMEYLKLYQAICSEVDTVGKEIASDLVDDFVVDSNTNIKQWGYNLQKVFGDIKDNEVVFYDIYVVKPFENWQYEEYDKLLPNGKPGKGLRIVKERKTIIWWRNYNNIKHQRVGLVSGKKNFQLANQKNVVLALAALFCLSGDILI